jgi:hypothetical protein
VRFEVCARFKIEENIAKFFFLAFAVTGHEAVLVRMELVAISAIFLPAFVAASPVPGIDLYRFSSKKFFHSNHLD